MQSTLSQPKLVSRHYQLEGIDYLTTPNVKLNDTDLFPTLCRHLLTDAPGSGKTHQASEASQQLVSNPAHSIVVIAPAHLCKQWYVAWHAQYPDDALVWFEGSKQSKVKDAATHARCYIISTQSFRHKHFAELYTKLVVEHHVDCIIIDESHYCKNKDSYTSHYIRTLCRPSLVPHVIALTATPIMKEADDLFSQLRILDPITFSRHDVFLNTYCWFNWTSWGATDIRLRRGSEDKLKPYMFGRSYKDIGLELSPVISQIHSSDMIPQRRKAYDNIKKYWYTLISDNSSATAKDGTPVLSANSAMEVMHMLRHIISSPEKQQDLTSYLQDDPGPYLIATFYRDSAKELAAHIQQSNTSLNVTVITGEVAADIRPQLAKQSNKPNDVVIATIPSISEGCDLSHCNTVYFYEENTVPGSMYQFLSRVRRHRNTSAGSLGVTITEDNHLHIDTDPNDRPIIVRYFHADNSIDQRIHAVQSNRSVNIRDLVKVELES